MGVRVKDARAAYEEVVKCGVCGVLVLMVLIYIVDDGCVKGG